MSESLVRMPMKGDVMRYTGSNANISRGNPVSGGYWVVHEDQDIYVARWDSPKACDEALLIPKNVWDQGLRQAWYGWYIPLADIEFVR
jgi:hypothetical protein